VFNPCTTEATIDAASIAVASPTAATDALCAKAGIVIVFVIGTKQVVAAPSGVSTVAIAVVTTGYVTSASSNIAVYVKSTTDYLSTGSSIFLT
jgi:uncharacterized protein YqkB